MSASEQMPASLKVTPKLERILRLAALEREVDGAGFTSTYHVVIAILLDDSSSASMILKQHGITLERLRVNTRASTVNASK